MTIDRRNSAFSPPWPPHPVRVQRCTPGQWELVRALRIEAVSNEPACFGTGVEQETARSEEEWRASLAVNSWLLASAEPLAPIGMKQRDRIAGMVAIYWTDRTPDGAPQLGAMWVAPEHRRTGVAARLVGAVEQLARIRGEGSVGLWVTSGNHRAERFYTRFGYRYTGARKRAPKDPRIDMQRMRHELRTSGSRGIS